MRAFRSSWWNSMQVSLSRLLSTLQACVHLVAVIRQGRALSKTFVCDRKPWWIGSSRIWCFVYIRTLSSASNQSQYFVTQREGNYSIGTLHLFIRLERVSLGRARNSRIWINQVYTHGCGGPWKRCPDPHFCLVKNHQWIFRSGLLVL